MGQSDGPRSGANGGGRSRCIALVGPYLSGKTTLLEAILARTGGVTRAGSVADKSTVGDASPEARDHGMSVSLNAADVSFLGDTFTFLDCPGSIEFQHEGALALTACDAAVVVCEPDPKRVPALQIILKQLEDRGIPHFLFLNKIDASEVPLRELIPVLQPASTKPLVLRQIPIWENGVATGFVDLASERAYVYRTHAPSEVIELPAGVSERKQEARFHMLEQLADYDDELMEQLLSDAPTPRDKIFHDLTDDLRRGLICPVLLGSAQDGHGIFRLLKALRHEAPLVSDTARRLKLENAKSAAYVLKTLHTAHGGKLSLVRVLTGDMADGTTVFGADGKEERAAGVFALRGEEPVKRGPRHRRAGPARRHQVGRDRHRGQGRRRSGQGGACARAGVRYRACAQGPQGRGEAHRRARETNGGRPLAVARAEPRHASDAAVGPGRDASARRLRAPAAQVRRRGRAPAASHSLQGDHPQIDGGARPPQEAIGRPRAVWRRRAGNCTAAA
jgi:elongation factor G